MATSSCSTRISLLLRPKPSGKCSGPGWTGQGPRVAGFERRFAVLVAPDHNALAVGSGTDALHLAHLLAGLVPEDEVIAPVFTCTAPSLPLLHMGVKPVSADVQPRTLCMDALEDRYLVLPLHGKMGLGDVERVCSVVESGW